MSIDKSVYYHSAERYNKSFALTRLAYCDVYTKEHVES